MKVRWTESGVRLRITPAEMASLNAGAPVREELRLPGGGNGHWSATIRPGAPDTALTLDGGDLLLALSPADLTALNAPDAEGVYFQTADSAPFRYFIEKDFPCVHPRAAEALEPRTETFPPPPDFEARKAG